MNVLENGSFKLDWDTFNNFLLLLKSEDINDNQVAYSILDQVDVEKNLCFILLIVKELSSIQRTEIQRNTKVIPAIKKLIPHYDGLISFSEIYEIIHNSKFADIQGKDFFMEKMAEHIEEMLKHWSIDFKDKYRLKFEKV